MRSLIVVPAYNEAGNVGRLVRAVRSYGLEQDLLVVDDGSSDATALEAKEAGALLIRHPVNLGVGAAEQTGYLFAEKRGYEAVVRLDADGQHPPAAVSTLLGELESGVADVVVGSRFLEAGGFRSSLLRRLGIKYLCWIIEGLCGLKVTDPTSGMRAVNRRALLLLARAQPEDYPEPESLLWLHRNGFRIKEVAVHMAERAGGSSSIGSLGSLYYLVKVTLALVMATLRQARR